MTLTLYTDGGCSGNKRDCECKGALAFVLVDIYDCKLTSGGFAVDNTTNNRMEMSAVLYGCMHTIEYLSKRNMKASECDLTIITDSQYVCDGFECYVEEWVRRGWRKSNGKLVLNSDLWKRLCSISPEFKSFRIQWVKGHADNKYNIIADGLVQSLLRSAKAK